MNEELKKELIESLKSHGVEEEVIDKVVNDLEAEKDDKLEDEKQEGDLTGDVDDKAELDGEETPTPESNDAAPVENPTDVPPTEDEAPVPPADDVAPISNPEDNQLPQGLDEVDPTAPVNDVPPQVDEIQPQVPAQPNAEMRSVIDEQDKVIKGLEARIASLEDALKKGGILTDEADEDKSSYGVYENQVDANHSVDDEKELDDILFKFNKHR